MTHAPTPYPDPMLSSSGDSMIIGLTEEDPEALEAWIEVYGLAKEANAEFVVKACNAYEELVGILIKYRMAQSRMLHKWADGDEKVKQELWGNLHSLEKEALDILEKAKME